MASGKQRRRRRPSKQEILALKKKLQRITKPFFDKYGSDGGKILKARKSGRAAMATMAADSETGSGEGGIDFLLIGPPGPRPPPKLEIEILNLSEY